MKTSAQRPLAATVVKAQLILPFINISGCQKAGSASGTCRLRLAAALLFLCRSILFGKDAHLPSQHSQKQNRMLLKATFFCF